MPVKEKPYRFVVRLPTEMRERLAEAAKYYRRSMNSEIIARLHQSFSSIPNDQDEKTLAPPLHKEMEQLFRRSLSEEEENMLRGFRRLGSDKRAALVSLLN